MRVQRGVGRWAEEGLVDDAEAAEDLFGAQGAELAAPVGEREEVEPGAPRAVDVP